MPRASLSHAKIPFPKVHGTPWEDPFGVGKGFLIVYPLTTKNTKIFTKDTKFCTEFTNGRL